MNDNAILDYLGEDQGEDTAILDYLGETPSQETPPQTEQAAPAEQNDSAILDYLGVEPQEQPREAAEIAEPVSADPNQARRDRVAQVAADQAQYEVDNGFFTRIRQRATRSYLSNRQTSNLDAAERAHTNAERGTLEIPGDSSPFNLSEDDQPSFGFRGDDIAQQLPDPGRISEEKFGPLDTVISDPFVREMYLASRNELLEQVSSDTETLESIPQAPVVEKGLQAESFGELLEIFAIDPVSFIAEIGLSSAVQSAEGLVGGAIGGITTGGLGTVAGAGVASAVNDYQGQFLGALVESGVDITNPEQVIAAFNDKNLMAEIKKDAAIHGAVVGLVDGVSVSIAAKTLLGNGSFAGKVANIGAQTGVGGALGGAGEALGTLATGEQINWNDVFAEVVGEAVQAPAEVGMQALVSAFESKQGRPPTPEEATQIQEYLDEQKGPSIADETIPDSVFFDSDNVQQQNLDLEVPELREQQNLFGEDIEPLPDLVPQITRQDKLDLDSAGFIEELSEFSKDDSNYADAFDELTELADLDSPVDVEGAVDDGPTEPVDTSDDDAIAAQIPFEGLSVDDQPVEQTQTQDNLDVTTDQGDTQESLDLSRQFEQQRSLDLDTPEQPQQADTNDTPTGVTQNDADGTTTDSSGAPVPDTTESDIPSDTQDVANPESTPNEEVATNEDEENVQQGEAGSVRQERDVRGERNVGGQDAVQRVSDQAAGNGQERTGRSPQSRDQSQVQESGNQERGVNENSSGVPRDDGRQGSSVNRRQGSNPNEEVSERDGQREPSRRERQLQESRRQAVLLKEKASKAETKEAFETALRDEVGPVEFARLQKSGAISTAFRQVEAERATQKSRNNSNQKVVRESRKFSKKSNNITVIEDTNDLPAAIKKDYNNFSGNSFRPAAIANNGQIYLIPQNIDSARDVRGIVVHEAVHVGLFSRYGDEIGMTAALGDIYDHVGGAKGFDELAERYGVNLSAYKEVYADHQFRDIILVEELLAHIAQNESGTLKSLAIKAQLILRNLMRRFGIFTDRDLNGERTVDEKIQELIFNALQDARYFAKNNPSAPRAFIGKVKGAYKGKEGTHLTGMPKTVKMDGKDVEFTGLKSAQDAAANYMNKAGLPYTPVSNYAPLDKDRATLIANEYEAMEHAPNDPEVKAAYEALVKETYAQYESMLDAGVQVEFNPSAGVDPYNNPRNATLDVVNNNHLYVFPTDEGFGTSTASQGNPLMERSPFMFGDRPALANDVFRAVHDYYGHVKDGNGFRAKGEEHAWRSHSAMYSPLARRAMTTETRGQNSWVNFGPNAESNQTANGNDTVFAEQKTGLLPEWVSEQGRVMDSNARASLGGQDLIESDKRPFSMNTLFGPVITAYRKDSRKRMRKTAKRWFTTSNNLPSEAFDLKLLTDNTQAIDQKRIEVLNRGFDKALRKNVARAKREEVSLKFNDYLSGSIALSELPPAMRPIAEAQRAYLDSHSIEIAAIVQQSIDDQVQRTSNEGWEQFQLYMETDGREGILPKGLERTLQLHGAIIGNLAKYLNRSFQAFDDPAWKGKALADTDLINRAKNLIRSENPNFNEGEVDGAVIAILDAAQDTGDITGLISRGATFGSKDVSILKKKDTTIDPVILELLGEYKDPKVNFTKSADKMSSFIANHHFLVNIREAGNGVFLFDKPTVKNDEEYTVAIAAKGSDSMNPLNGVYTTREIRQALKDFVDTPQFGPVMRMMMAASGSVKYGKTIIDLSVHVFNFIANFLLLTANGHLDPRLFVHAAKMTFGDISSTQNEDTNAYLERILRLGVIHDNPRSGELRDTVNEVMGKDGIITSNRILDKLSKGARVSLKSLEKLYQAEDDFFKIVAFESQLKKNLRAGMDQVEAEQHAAFRVRNGYPTYSMVPKAVVAVRQIPYIGSFPSFPYEVTRIGINQFKFLAEDTKTDRRSAAVRLVGMVAATSALQAAGVFSMILHGISPEEDELNKKMGPHWTRNSTFIYVGFDENGQPKYSDVSRYDPFDFPKRIIRAALNYKDRGLLNMDGSAAWEALEPFIGLDILAAAAYEAATNDRLGSSRPVRNTEDTDWEKAKDTFINFWDSTAPGSVIKASNIARAAEGKTTFYGRKRDVKDEILNFFGVRSTTQDIPVSYGFKLSEFKFRKARATALLSEVVNDQNDFTEAEITDAFNRMMAAREASFEFIVELSNHPRLDDKSRDARMANVGISKADRAAIRRGESAIWVRPKKYGRTKLEAALIGASPEDAARLKAIHRRKIGIIDRLLREQRKKRNR